MSNPVKRFAERRRVETIANPGSSMVAAFASSFSQKAFPGIPKQQLALHLLPYQYSADFRLISLFFCRSNQLEKQK
jgi:hypothetical protein